MQSYLSNPWNYAVSLLTMRFNEQELATGSCFFWKRDERIFLITNWHNLTGKNHLTGQLMSTNGALPNLITFTAFDKLTESDINGYFGLRVAEVEINLMNNDEKPRWYEHPTFGQKIDIGVIDVTEAVKNLYINCVNDIESKIALNLQPAQDVFVIGFPFGLIGSEPTPVPIWKRGSIGYDPNFNPENLPKLLIDTATRSGMSGSVVIARYNAFGNYALKDGTSINNNLYSQHDSVIGLYSGRHYPDYEKAQLGIVWKRIVIEETVNGKKIPN